MKVFTSTEHCKIFGRIIVKGFQHSENKIVFQVYFKDKNVYSKQYIKNDCIRDINRNYLLHIANLFLLINKLENLNNGRKFETSSFNQFKEQINNFFNVQ